jgi:uncharacterized RDD family membrane protein YckC
MTAPADPSYPSTTPGPLAEWPDRVIAALLDAALALGFFLVLLIVTTILGGLSREAGGVIFFLGYLAIAAYSPFYLGWMEGRSGQSPGKRLTGLKVVRQADGQVVGGGLGIVRKLAHLIDSALCGIGYLFPLWDPKKQTLADKVMATVVIKGLPRRPFGFEVFRP